MLTSNLVMPKIAHQGCLNMHYEECFPTFVEQFTVFKIFTEEQKNITPNWYAAALSCKTFTPI